MTLNLDQLKAQLVIDKSVLDDEVIRQPSLFYAISELLTDAVAERDYAKEELAATDARLSDSWRRGLSKGKERVTDKMVLTGVQNSEQHAEAFDRYLSAKTKADKLLALKEAFQQRSYMLRDLVSLYSANYYEVSSIKPTAAQDAAHYAANRAHMANARAKK